MRLNLLKSTELTFVFYFSFNFIAVSSSSVSKIPAIFSFGDANVETGNNNFINTNLKTNYPPFGETYFGAPSGRVTDGRITLDFLASYLNLPFVPPYLQPGANFQKGANFGSGGAAVLSIGDITSNRGIPLSDQLSNYFDLRSRSLNLSIPESTFSEALYYIQIGEVDYIQFVLMVETVGFLSNLQTNVMGRVVSEIEIAIRRLYESGARKFLIFTVYPLGCMPYLLARYSPQNGTCLLGPDQLVQAHNQAFSERVASLRTNLTEGDFLLVKSDQILGDVLTKPEAFGFESTSVACCGSGPFNGEGACGQEGYSLCPNPSRRIYWDQVHNTEAFFRIVADQAWNGTAYVEPKNLSQLF